jgi:hypothetical protein
MRHSDPSLTANVYTDPKLLDVRGALDALPSLPLDDEQNAMRERARATGTETYGHCSVALPVALTPDKPGQYESIPGKTATEAPNSIVAFDPAASAEIVKGKATLTTPDMESAEWAMRDSNPRPSACKAGALPTELIARRTRFEPSRAGFGVF